MAPAPTALPELDAPYTLSGDARRDFERDGHVLLRRVALPDEVAAVKGPFARKAEDARLGQGSGMSPEALRPRSQLREGLWVMVACGGAYFARRSTLTRLVSCG